MYNVSIDSVEQTNTWKKQKHPVQQATEGKGTLKKSTKDRAAAVWYALREVALNGVHKHENKVTDAHNFIRS